MIRKLTFVEYQRNASTQMFEVKTDECRTPRFMEQISDTNIEQRHQKYNQVNDLNGENFAISESSC